jgi:hypothetical protein
MSRFELQDRTGLCPLRMGTDVLITHPLAAYAGSFGQIVRIRGRQVWVQIRGTQTVCMLGHRSVEVQR